MEGGAFLELNDGSSLESLEKIIEDLRKRKVIGVSFVKIRKKIEKELFEYKWA